MFLIVIVGVGVNLCTFVYRYVSTLNQKDVDIYLCVKNENSTLRTVAQKFKWLKSMKDTL